MLDGFRHAMGVKDIPATTSVDARSALFRSTVHGRRILVLLDDAASGTQIRPLLPGSATVTVVVTSRSSLSGLKAMEGATGMNLEPLDDTESLSLLREIGGADLVDHDLAVSTDLVRMCANLPLVLRIVGERLGSGGYHSVAELVDELTDERDRLDVLATDDTSNAVRAVFSLSYKALEPKAAELFRLLGLLPGSEFGRDAVAALTGLRAGQLRVALEALRSTSMLEVPAPQRYRLHDLLRAYAAECAEVVESADRRQQAVHDLLAWYLSSAHATGRVLNPYRRSDPQPTAFGLSFDDAQTAMEWCSLEQTNLTAAVCLAAKVGEDATAWQLAAALWGFFYRRKPWEDWIATHNIGLAAAERTGDEFGTATMLGNLAIAYRELRQQVEAEDCFRRALEIWMRLGDRYGEALVCNGYGNACREWGRLDEALVHSQRALAGWQAVGDRHGEGITYNSLSGIYRQLDDLPRALAYSSRAAAVFRDLGDRYSEAWAQHSTATTQRELGNLTAAIELRRLALDIRVELGDRYGQALTLQDLAADYERTGQAEGRLEALRRALAIFHDLGDPKADEIEAALG
ncbi:tetratricopeptide repeat protein [Kutzneria kofuensis]|uniref:Tetratricopeptide (TPR) repeat protein n=1 Tax=Kutzneria kofuensis TaxID=103725 RepID=A0A7W9NLE4_9PSEU|nr:tetratricopeptide repeat protein [Kutzneria kofuensis]MBB5896679.1 tetratricopeptide (TPR) repeat protein [Kutzneria kofuensis]